VRGCMRIAVGLRRGTGVSAQPRGSGLFRRVLRVLLLDLLCRLRRLIWPRGRCSIALCFRSYRVYRT
jgi:hypothetical protein